MRHFLSVLAAASLVAPAAQAAPSWVEARTEHLVIDIDADEGVARNYAIKLERFDAALRRLYGVADDPTRRVNPLHIYALKEGMFERICQCSSAAGFYEPSAAGSAIFSIYQAKLDDKMKQGDMTPQVILLHEYSHHFMYSSYPIAYPLWYSEGFAEFNANVVFQPDGAIAIGYPANYRTWSIRNEYSNLYVEEFFEPSSGVPLDTLYGRGWLMTHYLTLDPKRKGQLATYLDAFNKGKSSMEAATIAFGDVKKLYGELFDYRDRKNGLAKPLRVPAAAKTPDVTVTKLSDGAVAMMPYHLLAAHRLSAKRAKEVIKDARRIADMWQSDARAQVDLAAIAIAADDLDTADMGAERALAAEPDNRDALLYKGQVAVRRASRSSTSGAAEWTAARSWYLKANKLAPDAPLPLLYYYQSFVTAKQAPSKGAVIGLKRAVVLAPEDSAIRLLLARRMIDENDPGAARSLLQPIAFSPHERTDDNVARNAITAIDAGKLADAGKAIDAAIAEDAKIK